MKKKCTEECENCIYIGEGDFICDEALVLVVDDWVRCNEYCVLKDKKKQGEKNKKDDRKNN